MKPLLIALPGIAAFIWSRKERAGLPEAMLGIAGLAAFLFGVSFVKGAVEEEEPRAAEMGLKLFCGGGAALMLAARLLGRARRR